MSEKQHETCMVQSDKYSRGVIRRPGGVINLTCISGPAVEASRQQFSLERETMTIQHVQSTTITRSPISFLPTLSVGGKGGSVGRAALKSLSYLPTAWCETDQNNSAAGSKLSLPASSLPRAASLAAACCSIERQTSKGPPAYQNFY